jgi:hypothetical protein
LLPAAALMAATGAGQKYTAIWDSEEPVRSFSTRFTGPASPNGLPRLYIPCGLAASGLTVRTRFIGRSFDEVILSRYGYASEKATSSGGPARRSGTSSSSYWSSPSRVVVLLLLRRSLSAAHAFAGSSRSGPIVPHLKQRTR